jgi:hypothetical protein
MNLDYLSAEDWVVGCHGLPSVKYKQVQKFFFFPGSTRAPVACCVKAILLERREQFQQSPAAQRLFLQGLGSIAHPARN